MHVLPLNLVPIEPMKSELPNFYTKKNFLKRNSLPSVVDEMQTLIRKPQAVTLQVPTLKPQFDRSRPLHEQHSTEQPSQRVSQASLVTTKRIQKYDQRRSQSQL